MDIEKSIRKIDTALAAVRQEAIRKLMAKEAGVVGAEISIPDNGGVRPPRWWSRRDTEIKN